MSGIKRGVNMTVVHCEHEDCINNDLGCCQCNEIEICDDVCIDYIIKDY